MSPWVAGLVLLSAVLHASWNALLKRRRPAAVGRGDGRGGGGRVRRVVLLAGAASLQYEDGTVEMKPGDVVNISARRQYRVEWTTPDEPTVWLAVHCIVVPEVASR